MASQIDSTNSLIDNLRELRDHLGLAEGEEVDREGVMVSIINRVAILANNYTGRLLKSRAYVSQLYDGTGFDTLTLPQFPVDLSATFTVYADAGRTFGTLSERWDQTSSMGSASYYVEADEGTLIRIDGGIWPSGKATVRVTYTAGVTAANAPDLVQVILEECAAWWFRIGRDPALVNLNDAGVSQAITAGTGPFSGKFAALSAQARLTLDMHSNAEFMF